MLAVTVFLTQSQGTIFGDYRGKELMAMGNQSRLEYLGATFRRCEAGAVVRSGTMFSGDCIFFHTGHIHKAPPPARPVRGTSARPTEPRRTFFFGFDSDQKTCETEFVRACDFKQHWEPFKDGKASKKRREVRRAAVREVKKTASKKQCN